MNVRSAPRTGNSEASSPGGYYLTDAISVYRSITGRPASSPPSFGAHRAHVVGLTVSIERRSIGVLFVEEEHRGVRIGCVERVGGDLTGFLGLDVSDHLRHTARSSSSLPALAWSFATTVIMNITFS